jgi:hypothetical protein
MLLIFGGADRLHFEYEEKFVCRYRDRLASLPSLVDVHVIEWANHLLSLAEWREEMMEHSARWLRAHFSADLRVSSNEVPCALPATKKSEPVPQGKAS